MNTTCVCLPIRMQKQLSNTQSDDPLPHIAAARKDHDKQDKTEKKK